MTKNWLADFSIYATKIPKICNAIIHLKVLIYEAKKIIFIHEYFIILYQLHFNKCFHLKVEFLVIRVNFTFYIVI